jgi:glucose dehydrogenase
MAKYLTDLLFFAGLALLAAGVWLAFGVSWALIISGLALVITALLTARGQSER